MRRRVLLCLTLISLSACNGDKIGQPISSPISPPSRSISDGTFALGNPDFFFLPPMVKNPSSNPNWTAGGFNGTLHPIVHVCEMSGTTEQTATLTSTCSDLATSVSLADEQYSVNWKVPSSATVFYRLSVVAGTKVLGWADVETASNASQLKNVTTGEYVPLVDGRTLPVKFRIERYALCDVPGKGPCASSSVDLNTGGTVSTVVVADGRPAGIVIPAGAGTSSTTITVQSCPNLPLDIPLFGTCVRVTADPALPPAGFTAAATVFICDVDETSVLSRVADHAQADRITLHRMDPGSEGPVFTALPHAPACGSTIGSTGGSLRGMFAALRHGDVRGAAKEMSAMLSPTPLYAARFIDLGGGGFTSELSDFQFALPSKFDVVPETDGQSGALGSTLALPPTVHVTDLANVPVQGATVHFATSTGSVAAPSAVSDAAGHAGVAWTIATGSVANQLFASGRGIASPDNNGPRDEFDPYQPIQTPFDPSGSGGPVNVGTGTLTFTATGRLAVLIYGPTLTPTDGSHLQNEQTLASAAGLDVTVWDAATWSSKTTSDFARFNAIVFPDPIVSGNCAVNTLLLATADATKAAWSPAVNGPIVIVGSDPMEHSPVQPQAVTLMSNAVKFAASNPAATGLYATLSCYYFSASSTVPTAISFLSGIGSFNVLGQSGLGQAVTIANSGHPVMAGLTSAGLSNWHDSAHEAFPILASYPAGFAPLALINKPATDENLPYIIARGTPAP